MLATLQSFVINIFTPEKYSLLSFKCVPSYSVWNAGNFYVEIQRMMLPFHEGVYTRLWSFTNGKSPFLVSKYCSHSSTKVRREIELNMTMFHPRLRRDFKFEAYINKVKIRSCKANCQSC